MFGGAHALRTPQAGAGEGGEAARWREPRSGERACAQCGRAARSDGGVCRGRIYRGEIESRRVRKRRANQKRTPREGTRSFAPAHRSACATAFSMPAILPFFAKRRRNHACESGGGINWRTLQKRDNCAATRCPLRGQRAKGRRLRRRLPYSAKPNTARRAGAPKRCSLGRRRLSGWDILRGN